MSLSGADRAFAIYQSIPNTQALSGAVDGSGKPTAAQVQQPDGSMGPSEKYKLLQGLAALWGADTAYLTGNAVVLPTALQNPSGQPVATSGSAVAQTGTTTAPANITGTGKIT